MTPIADQLADALRHLVPPSVMIPELLRLMGDDTAELRAIGRCVASDPILAGDALRVANSVAYMSATGPINDCVVAVVRLGEALLCSLVADRLRASLVRSPAAVDGDRAWRHALRVAIGARIIARKTRFTQSALAFTAGLLVDVGKLVLAQVGAGRAAAVRAMSVSDPSLAVDEAERRVFGVDHAAVGELAARAWRIPDPIPAAIGASHRPMDARGEARLPAVVIHAADVIVSRTDVAAGLVVDHYRVDTSALAALKLDEDGMARIGQEIEAEFRIQQRAMGLSEPAPDAGANPK